MPSFETLHRVRTAASLVQPRHLALRAFRCPMCGPSVLLRLSRETIGVRCLRCGASAATLSLARVLEDVRPGFRSEAVYEMSSRGPWFRFLRRDVPRLTGSEYFDDLQPGAWRGGVQCQDVQRLTFADASFGVCTSTEVFEHVPDDARGFREIRRVLRPGGIFVFTVPLSRAQATVERAALRDGEVEHLLPPAYHGDRIRGRGKVLVYRDYGMDIVERLRREGFAEAWIDGRFSAAFLGHGSAVVVARAR
jgi:SAM-dependent methyltransferase